MIDETLSRAAISRSQAVTACQCDRQGAPEQYVCQTAQDDPVDPWRARSHEIAAEKPRPRVPLFWVIMVALVTTFLVFIARSILVTPMENRLLAEQARSLAKDLDTVVKVRCAAVHVAAGNMDIDNLSASGGLERLLTDLRAILPDFSSLEIINDQGQTIAMMGNVALSIIGQPVDRQALVAIKSGEPLQKVLFLDDLANQGFFIALSHVTPDGRQWFSRTRFSRKPIDAILKSSGSGLQATLAPLSSELAGPSATSGSSVGGQSNAMSATPAVRTTKRWYGEVKAAEADLLTPGWTLSVETHSTLTYLAQVLIPGLLALIICLVYQVAKTRSRDGEALPISMAAVRTSPEVTAEPQEQPSVVHPAEKDSTESAEMELTRGMETEDTLSEAQPEYFGCEAPSEPCEESACMEETDLVGEIPETLEVSWLETLSVDTRESEDPQQEPVRTIAEPNYVMTSP